MNRQKGLGLFAAAAGFAGSRNDKMIQNGEISYESNDTDVEQVRTESGTSY